MGENEPIKPLDPPAPEQAWMFLEDGDAVFGKSGEEGVVKVVTRTVGGVSYRAVRITMRGSGENFTYSPSFAKARIDLPVETLHRDFVWIKSHQEINQKDAGLLHMHEFEARFQFYPQQKESLGRIPFSRNVLIASETGCGKTLMGLAWARKLPKNRNILVIAPQGTVKGEYSQWAKECRRFMPGYRVVEMDEYTALEETECPTIYLTWPQAAFGKHSAWRFLWDCVILDEAHIYRNMGNTPTDGLERLICHHKCALSATPIYDTTMDLFPVLGWLRGWNSKYFPYPKNGIERFRSDMRDPAALVRLLAPFTTRITKEGCRPGDMPSITIKTHLVDMGRDDRELYDRQAHRRCHPNPAVATRLRMSAQRNVCCSPSLINRVYSDNTAKNRAIISKILDAVTHRQKVLYIGARLRQTTWIEKVLQKHGVCCARIDGSTPSNTHAAEAKVFREEPENKVLLMGIRCAQAYSFDNCHTVIIGSLEWTYGSWDQAIGRAYRLTSRHDVEIHLYLCKNSIEEHMLETVMLKKSLSDKALAR
jgi:superfamily II DNA or RNA helicase